MRGSSSPWHSSSPLTGPPWAGPLDAGARPAVLTLAWGRPTTRKGRDRGASREPTLPYGNGERRDRWERAHHGRGGLHRLALGARPARRRIARTCARRPLHGPAREHPP